MDFFFWFPPKNKVKVASQQRPLDSFPVFQCGMCMFSLYPCRFSPDTPFGGEQKMEGRAPAHCSCVPGSLTSFSYTSPQILLPFFQLPASTCGLQPAISLCKHMRSETRSYACQVLITCRLIVFLNKNIFKSVYRCFLT